MARREQQLRWCIHRSCVSLADILAKFCVSATSKWLDADRSGISARAAPTAAAALGAATAAATTTAADAADAAKANSTLSAYATTSTEPGAATTTIEPGAAVSTSCSAPGATSAVGSTALPSLSSGTAADDAATRPATTYDDSTAATIPVVPPVLLRPIDQDASWI